MRVGISDGTGWKGDLTGVDDPGGERAQKIVGFFLTQDVVGSVLKGIAVACFLEQLGVSESKLTATGRDFEEARALAEGYGFSAPTLDEFFDEIRRDAEAGRVADELAREG